MHSAPPGPPRITRRRVLTTAAAGLAAAVTGPALSACGTSSAPATTGRRQVNFVTAKLASGSQTMRQFVEAYNRSQNRFEVVVRDLPTSSSSTEVHQLLVQQLGADDAEIDAFTMDIVWVAEFASAGWSLDLTGEFGDYARERCFPAVTQACTYRDRLHAVPWNVSAGLLYYRKDLLAANGFAAPTSWVDDLVPQAEHFIRTGQTENGYLWQGQQAEAMVCNVIELIASAGGSVLGVDGRSVHVADEPAVAAVQFLYDTITRYRISPSATRSWAEQPSRAAFWSGKAPYLRMWSASWANTQDPSVSTVAGRVGLSSLPRFPGGRTASCLGGYQLGVAQNSKNKDGAIDFVRWLSSAAVERRYYDVYGYPPAATEFWEAPDMASSELGKAFRTQVLEGGTPRPVTPDYPQITLALQSFVSKALTYGDVRTYMQECADAIAAIVKR